MPTLEASQVRRTFAETLSRVAYGGERIVIKRYGKSTVVLVSTDDLALLEQLEDHLDVAATKKTLKERGSIPWGKVKRRLGLK